jgi:Mn2+/Fe2+ NRAMP family transporter
MTYASSQVVLSFALPFAIIPLVHLTGKESFMGKVGIICIMYRRC